MLGEGIKPRRFQRGSIVSINNRPFLHSDRLADTMTRLSLEKTSLDSLDNDDRLRVLGIVDQFRELGINEDISLPQASCTELHALHARLIPS